eukprot:CAMPEP_0172422646 /NCGR_PEP_ID=MMETSP1064-20121228/8780_1 /TAXON_ID=202472 /ORGANISM="Aulacoseira subarctica , Strain CCAP 1002/5" /LENGTH=398 /DNA_ID=CAMNT_0013163601 /DNA_START=88 /DNA_END=1284 /DNA_ORIENTATION=+
MEDRHTISEPRRREVTQLEWEVDILRESIVVDTIIINCNTLPPRKQKKTGKILWCLPDKDDKLPSFGTEERRRILDIFRNRRKLRKKATRTSATTNEDSTIANDNIKNNEFNNEVEDTNQSQEENKEQMTVKNSSSSNPLPNAPPPGFDVYSNAPLINPPPGFDVGAATQNEGQQGSPSALSLDEQATTTTTTTVPTTILSPKYICYFPPLSSWTATTQPKQLAKQFLELYYAIFSSTTEEEESLAIASLLPFYTPSFQKSISINGVHSVVSANIIALVQQLQYAINTIRNSGTTASGGKLIDIQSVVAQDLSDSGGVLIMVAGTTTNTTTFFSHTVTLVPMRSVPIPTSSSTILPAPGLSEEYHNSNNGNIATTATEKIVVTGYQIYNDAFMLLSSS